tara:strand:+ start:247 stop:471 length:225 start_codon:yes stop_codon:yes gene_type:complete
LLFGPISLPKPGPTFDSEDAAPEIDVIKSNPVKVKSDARTKNINIYRYIKDIIDAISLSSTLLLLYFKFIIALG